MNINEGLAAKQSRQESFVQFSDLAGAAVLFLCLAYGYFYTSKIFNVAELGSLPQLCFILMVPFGAAKFILDENRAPLRISKGAYLFLLGAITIFVLPDFVIDRSTGFLVVMVMAITFSHNSIKSFVWWFTIVSALFLIFHTLLLILGVIQTSVVTSYTSDGSVVVRNSLGFSNVNSYLVYLSPVLLGTVYLVDNARKCRFIIAVSMLLCVFIYYLTGARTGAIALLVALSLLFFYTLFEKASFFRFLQKLAPASFLIFTILSILIAYIYGESTNNISELLSRRPEYWLYALNNTNQIWGGGGNLQLNSYSNVPIDNAYISILFSHGLISVFFLALLYGSFMFHLTKSGDTKMQIVSLAFLVYGLAEANCSAIYNFTFALVFIHLFHSNIFQIDVKKEQL